MVVVVGLVVGEVRGRVVALVVKQARFPASLPDFEGTTD
jgi:hypothetical protein